MAHSGTAAKIAPLEGLRAIAVTLVVLNHTLNIPKGSTDYFAWWAPGPAGVRLFFVLSGFLITGILLRARTAESCRGRILRAFYARRALRILPLASAAILVACLFNVESVRERWPWYATYTINLRVAVLGDSADFGLRHFWSLAVEEQFYVVWALLVLWLPRRHLGRAMYAMIVTAAIVRLALLLADQPLAAYVLMPSRLDSLAAGGVLAWSLERAQRPPRWLWFAGVAAVAVGAALSSGAWSDSWMEGGMVIVSVMIVDRLRHMERSAGYRAIAHPVLVYLGGISYGIYVWHALLPYLIRSFEQRTGILLHLTYQMGGKRLVYIFLAGTAAAVTSWYLLERPLNSLKRYFPYVRPATVTPPEGAGVTAWSSLDSDQPAASQPASRV